MAAQRYNHNLSEIFPGCWNLCLQLVLVERRLLGEPGYMYKHPSRTCFGVDRAVAELGRGRALVAPKLMARLLAAQPALRQLTQ
jgi:hypothetical protein